MNLPLHRCAFPRAGDGCADALRSALFYSIYGICRVAGINPTSADAFRSDNG